MRLPHFKNVSMQSKLAFRCQGPVQRSLAILMISVLSMSSTLAKPSDEYCISQIGQKLKPTKIDSSADTKLKQITINTANGLFDVFIDRSHLVLKRQGNSTQLATVKVPQDKFSIIDSLTLARGGWLWVDGHEIDYMVSLNTGSSLPNFGTPVAFPKITSKPCSMLSDFFDNCLHAQGVYSSILDRTFIEGHHINFFGLPEPVSFEMTEGIVKALPKPLQGARFVVDVPTLKGALFRGAFDEALFFYDGSEITILIKGSSAQWTDNGTPTWYWTTLPNQRTYLTNFAYKVDKKFLMELITGPTLNSINIPDELNKDGLRFFSHKQDPRLWGVGLYKVVVESRGRLHTLIKIDEPSFIDGFKGTGQDLGGTLTFTVKNPEAKSSTQYFIVKSSSTAQCKATLDINKPIFLSE
jgi:hypothetical protein